MTRRIVLVVMGIVLSYFSVSFGDGMARSIVALPTDSIFRYLILFIGSVFIGGGFASFSLFWVGYIREFAVEEGPTISVLGDYVFQALLAACSASCAPFLFGVLARPFSTYGFYPWMWAKSPFFWFFLVALLPLAFVVVDLIEEMELRRAHQEESKTRGKVVPLRGGDFPDAG